MSEVLDDFQNKVEDFGDAVKCLDYDDKINVLKKLALEYVEIQAKYDYIDFRVEKLAEAEKSIVNDKRAKVIREMLKIPTGDGPEKMVIYFWLDVLKSSELRDCITKDDEPILQHMYDIRSTTSPEIPYVHFVLEFYFEPNEYFSNTKLVKTYYTLPLSEWDNKLEYEGYKIDRCDGCKINWTVPEATRRKQKYLSFWSFFDFFDPPIIPKDFKDYSEDDIRMRKRVLKQDFYIGCYFKEHLIPRAFLYFTRNVPDEKDESDFDDLEFYDDDDDAEDEDGEGDGDGDGDGEVDGDYNENRNDNEEFIIRDGKIFYIHRENTSIDEE